MKTIYILVLSLFCVQLIADVEMPQNIIENIFKKASEINFKSNKENQSIVSSYFDYDIMTNKIFGKDLAKYKNKDIEQFKSYIKEIIELTVYPKSYDFLKSVKVDFSLNKKDSKNALVQALVKKRGEETEVICQLELVKERWRVVDISIDDESWVANIHEQVMKTIKNKQWSGLMSSLQKRLEDLRLGKASNEKLDG